MTAPIGPDVLCGMVGFLVNHPVLLALPWAVAAVDLACSTLETAFGGCPLRADADWRPTGDPADLVEVAETTPLRWAHAQDLDGLDTCCSHIFASVLGPFPDCSAR